MSIANSDVKNIAASAAVYQVDTENNIFTFNSSAPALEYSGDGLLKKDFQKILVLTMATLSICSLLPLSS